MPERNDPCSCGSGKKYKKCCMKDYSKGGKWNLPATSKHNSPEIEQIRLPGAGW